MLFLGGSEQGLCVHCLPLDPGLDLNPDISLAIALSESFPGPRVDGCQNWAVTWISLLSTHVALGSREEDKKPFCQTAASPSQTSTWEGKASRSHTQKSKMSLERVRMHHTACSCQYEESGSAQSPDFTAHSSATSQ